MTSRSLRDVVVLGPLLLTSLALSHELIYLVAHGPAGYALAMTERGHDRYWTTFVLVVAGLGMGLLAAAGIELRRLKGLADDVKAGSVLVADAGVDRYARLLVPLWLRIAASTVVTYFLQENIETASTGRALPGLAVIGDDHVLALPVLILASLLVAAVGSLVRWRRDVLLARIEGASGRPRRSTSAARRVALVTHRGTGRYEGAANPVRAPPLAGSPAPA